MANAIKFFTDAVKGSQITVITGSDLTDVYSGKNSVDRVIRQFIISSDDTSDQTATISMNDGTNSVILGKVTIPDGAGTNGTDAAVDVIASLATIFTEVDNAANKQLVVPSEWYLEVAMGSVTSGKKIMVTILGAAE
jgi:hypothetical protein